ncbi:MAG: hypothetical protein E7460_05075 [Ruminococcaceae bacterium]|nr:hypothetical protein [Oscillospiraceae bacterium]
MKKRAFRLLALLLCAVTLLPMFSACGGDSVTVITVNGEAIKKTDFMVHLFTVKHTVYQSQLADGTITYADLYHLDEETLNDTYSQGYTFKDYLRSATTSSAISAVIYRCVAMEEGITLTRAEKISAKQRVEEWKKTLGGGQAYNIFLKENRISEKALYRYYCDMIYMNKIKEEFGDYGKYAMTEEELTAAKREYFDSYYTIDYIYFSKRDNTVGLLLSDAGIAEKYASAKDCLSRLKAGEDFYTLRKAYSDEAYKTITFTEGSLTSDIFMDNASKLRINEYTDVIDDPDNYCYYILHRIETNEDQWANYYGMLNDANFQAHVNEYSARAEYVYKSAYDTLELN